ncbi:hypothetical protein [Fusobacterium sp. PH5-7]|uniref:hypothetical protein n=1 Tax=Fusobacterium sp. PH5-7 TaxID=2940528 RepID=UPI002475B5BC|nr:hypothetical protein [Fusobacterium sp. PH5-7]
MKNLKTTQLIFYGQKILFRGLDEPNLKTTQLIFYRGIIAAEAGYDLFKNYSVNILPGEVVESFVKLPTFKNYSVNILLADIFIDSL